MKAPDADSLYIKEKWESECVRKISQNYSTNNGMAFKIEGLLFLYWTSENINYRV